MMEYGRTNQPGVLIEVLVETDYGVTLAIGSALLVCLTVVQE
jgi:hypothetical protein